MNRVIKIKGNYGQDDKYILIKEYEGWGIYQEKCPTGYFVHQSYLFTNEKITVVCDSFNNVCEEEILDAIDSYNETKKFGMKMFNRGNNLLIVHCQGTPM